MNIKTGILYILATPIGNLTDFSPRAINTLNDVDMIACEDTRHTKKLLSHFKITKPTISFHAGSNPIKIINILKEGQSVALVSDAGTPTISDPGFNLIAQATENNISVSPIPGPSAIITALCASGFACHHFEFFGFIPHKKGRQKMLQTIAELNHVAVFYESTHRIIKCLEQMMNFFTPDRQIVLAREMTKIYEEFLRGTPEEIFTILKQHPEKQKGEFVVIVKAKNK